MTDKKIEMMDEDRFWAIVEATRWEEWGFDYEASGRILRMELETWALCESFRATFEAMTEKLYLLIEYLDKKGQRVPVSDDGASDLTAHIVGLGKTQFLTNLVSPELLLERAQKHSYKESFAYAIPYKEYYDPHYPMKHEAQRRRDRVAKDLGSEIESAITVLFDRAKLVCPDLGNGHVRHYASAGLAAAIRNAFPPKNNDED